MKQGQDIALLKEVLSLNPYNIPQGRGWLQVAEALNEAGLPVDTRRCRERTALLLEYFRKENKEILHRYVINLYFRIFFPVHVNVFENSIAWCRHRCHFPKNVRY